MSLRYILILFLSQMAVGMVVTASLIPTRFVEKKFFRGIFFWSLLFAASAVILHFLSTLSLPEIFQPPHFSFLGKTLWTLFIGSLVVVWLRLWLSEKPVSQKIFWAVSALGIVSLTCDSFLFRPLMQPSWIPLILMPVNFISTALLLGGFLTGMMFGHSYLVDVEIPKKLLVTMAGILIAVLVIRILAVGATLLVYKYWVYPDTPFLKSLISFQGHGIFFWERILVGLFIPAIVVGLIWSTAKIGSNQSATGIMYVAVAFVFIGELAARYLFFLSAIPL